MFNRIKNMSIRGRIELSVAFIFVLLMTTSFFTTMKYKTTLETEKATSLRLEFQLSSAKIDLNFNEAKAEEEMRQYQARSVTFKELEMKERAKIQSYVKRTFRTIPKSMAKLIAESTTTLAKKYELDTSVIIGMMKVESNFNASAVSNKGARGLMQVRWSVWKKVLSEKLGMEGQYDLHNIHEGIEAGVIVFKHYLEKNKGNVSKALYDYVGKNRPYVKNVYETIGRFMLYEQGKVGK